MKTIVIYHSSTGFTERYARWIAEAVGGDALALSAAKGKDLSAYDAIVFGSWAMGGTVSKLDWFSKNMAKWSGKKLTVFCTGASPRENPELDSFLHKNQVAGGAVPLFYCPAGMCYERMPAHFRLMMKLFTQMLKAKKDKTEADEAQIRMISTSYDISDKKYIQPILEHLSAK